MNRPKRGMALVVVLLLMAVMSVLASQIMGRLHQTIKLSQHQQYSQQVYWLATSAENLTLQALAMTLGREKRVHLGQQWAKGPQSFPSPDGMITLSIRDMQACYNLNVLTATRPQPGSHSRPLAVLQLIALLESQDIDEKKAQQIADSLWVFLAAKGSVHTQYGAEDNEYLSQNKPFLMPKKKVTDLSEIRAVKGMDALIYRKLQPLVCAIPEVKQRVNVNTLNLSQSAVLVALFTPYLSLEQAQETIKNRPRNGWLTLDEFFSEAALAGVNDDIKPILRPLLAVSSHYFHLHSIISTEENIYTFNSTIARYGAKTFDVIWHQFGELE